MRKTLIWTLISVSIGMTVLARQANKAMGLIKQHREQQDQINDVKRKVGNLDLGPQSGGLDGLLKMLPAGIGGSAAPKEKEPEMYIEFHDEEASAALEEKREDGLKDLILKLLGKNQKPKEIAGSELDKQHVVIVGDPNAPAPAKPAKKTKKK